MTRLTLVSYHLCPYVQRAVIALTEKGVPFERRQIDLADKPGWFKDLSPLGKVPLLLVTAPDREVVIFESAAILEYLEETHSPALHPPDPLDRARHRSWIEFGSSILAGIARLYGARDDTGYRSGIAGIGKLFDRIETHLTAQNTGPYFDGPRFSLVDAVFGPVLRYLDTFEAAADLHLMGARPRLAAWRRALAARPSIRDAVGPDYPVRLASFLRDRDGVLGRRIAA